MVPFDLGNKTVKEILEKSLGPDAASRVMQKVNDAYQQGKRDKELHQQFIDAMQYEGKPITADQSDILFGFIAPAVIA